MAITRGRRNSGGNNVAVRRVRVWCQKKRRKGRVEIWRRRSHRSGGR
jgi:hypothetical protein